MVKIFEFILVYPLHMPALFSYILSFLQFLEQDSELVHMSYYITWLSIIAISIIRYQF